MCHDSSEGLDLSEGVSYDNLVDVISQGYAPSLRVAPGSATNPSYGIKLQIQEPMAVLCHRVAQV